MAWPPSRILISRTDALGDALLALPVCTALRHTFPQASVTYLASAYTADAIRLQVSGPDNILHYEPQARHAGRSGLKRLVQELAQGHYDAALLIFPDRRVSWAVLRAGIGLRVGTSRRWWSWLYNRRVSHKRSQANRHEAEYNLDLVRALGINATVEPPRLLPIPTDQAWAETYIQSQGLTTGPWVILHPGGRGSAANWPAKKYGQLAARLYRAGLQPFLTGGVQEQALLQTVAQLSGQTISWLRVSVSLGQLAALISRSRAFISGSTGPMHLAAGVGVATVSLFPPEGVTGPIRWRPLSSRATVLVPDRGMGVESIAVETVLKAILAL